MQETPRPMIVPLQFRLLFNWETEFIPPDALLKNQTRMYPAFKVQLNDTPIYRLIEHEFECHYISAGQLFKAKGITATEGLLMFDLQMADFQVDFLTSYFPYCDIWVSVDQARHMAVALGVEQELRLLLCEELDACFSSDNTSRDEMMHNWIVPSIPHLQYSTRALLEATFESVEEPQPSHRKIQTQISRSKQKGMAMKDKTESGLVRWQVREYEQFLQPGIPILDCSASVWDALQGILSDLQRLRRGGASGPSRVSDYMLVGNMRLKKEYLHQRPLLQQLYTAVMAEKIMNEIVIIAGLNQHEIGATANTEAANRSIMLIHGRMDLIEQELYKVKRKSEKRFEEMETNQQEFVSQLGEFRQWRGKRVWIFIACCIVIYLVIHTI